MCLDVNAVITRCTPASTCISFKCVGISVAKIYDLIDVRVFCILQSKPWVLYTSVARWIFKTNHINDCALWHCWNHEYIILASTSFHILLVTANRLMYKLLFYFASRWYHMCIVCECKVWHECIFMLKLWKRQSLVLMGLRVANSSDQKWEFQNH